MILRRKCFGLWQKVKDTVTNALDSLDKSHKDYHKYDRKQEALREEVNDIRGRIKKANKDFENTTDLYDSHKKDLRRARTGAESHYDTIRGLKNRGLKPGDSEYDAAVKGFKKEMGNYRWQMKRAKNYLGLSRGTLDELSSSRDKFIDDDTDRVHNLHVSLRSKLAEREKAKGLRDSSAKRVEDIKDARRNLAIAGAVGLGAAGLGYGIYKWRKNKKKLEKKNYYNNQP